MIRATSTRRCLVVAGARTAGALALLAGVPATRAASAGVAAVATSGTVALAASNDSKRLYRASADRLLHRSDDGGRRWTPIASSLVRSGGTVTSLAVAAGDQGALYLAGRGMGVLRSDDNGTTWSARNEGLVSLNVAALTAHADRPDTLYAHVPGSGIFRSEDAGARWRLMDAGPRGGITRLVHSNMPGSMQSGWLFVAGPRGIQRAMDCFCGWRDAGELKRAAHAVTFDPEHPANIYAAIGRDLVFSNDGGQVWSAIDSPAARAGALVVGSGSALYVADGAAGGLFRRVATERSWERLDG